MKSTYLDDAFNWLVVLLGTIAATICQFPELIPLYQLEGAGTTLIVRVVVFPLLVLVVLWLAGSLVRKVGAQTFWKSLAWMFASLILAADIVLLLIGSVPIIHELFMRGEVGMLQSTVLLELILAIPFYLFVIRPRMRELYKESRFILSLPVQVVLALAAFALYLLAIGVVEAIAGVGPF